MSLPDPYRDYSSEDQIDVGIVPIAFVIGLFIGFLLWGIR